MKLGFMISKAGTSLFIYNKSGIIIYLLVYVDDIIIMSSSSATVTTLLQDLSSYFALKDLCNLSYFLGIHVTRSSDGLLLSQERYAFEILHKACMSNCKPVKTPLASSEKLLINNGKILSEEEATKYRGIVGGDCSI
jgi:hypothetical protein